MNRSLRNLSPLVAKLLSTAICAVDEKIVLAFTAPIIGLSRSFDSDDERKFESSLVLFNESKPAPPAGQANKIVASGTL
jgi:hypothetical protein